MLAFEIILYLTGNLTARGIMNTGKNQMAAIQKELNQFLPPLTWHFLRLWWGILMSDTLVIYVTDK